MKRPFSSVLAGVAVLGATLAYAPAVHAEERVCRGTIGATVVDNLRVPQGTYCVLNRTYVQGTVKVEGAASLRAYRVRVVGNVQAEGHRGVAMAYSVVAGSIQLEQGGNASLGANRVGSDIQLFTNRGSQVVNRNRINGNLQCKSNIPAPRGSGNVVGGNKEDQCRRL